MNQSQLARASGLTRAAISKWESNPNSKPDAAAALSVAKALGVPFEGLIAETRTKPNRNISKADSARGEELILLLRNHLQFSVLQGTASSHLHPQRPLIT